MNMSQKPYFPYFLIAVVLLMILSACGSPEGAGPTLDMNAVFTQVAATVAADYTLTAQAMPAATNTPESTVTPPPSPTLAQSAILTPPPVAASPTFLAVTAAPTFSSTAYDCYDAALEADVTIPDGTKFDPGDSFEKTWRVKNTGTCDWTADFKITYVGGDLFGSDTTKIRQRVLVDSTKDITLRMVAPSSSGTVTSSWQMATDDENLFGPVLTVSIKLPGSTTTSAGTCYHATLVSDVTIPAGTEFDPGDSFKKTWEVLNSGTCAWTNDFKITFVGGNLLGSDTTKIRKRVDPGDSTNISLSMVAPSDSGSVTSSWQMADDSGNLFGNVFTVEIVVK
jgi:hypothetical protein